MENKWILMNIQKKSLGIAYDFNAIFKKQIRLSFYDHKCRLYICWNWNGIRDLMIENLL